MGRTNPAGDHNFYPRPPRGGRPSLFWTIFSLKQFLSTPSARRATVCGADVVYRRIISIHALREEGDGLQFCLDRHQEISIHALREEGDLPSGYRRCKPLSFLSTPSARRATHLAFYLAHKLLISIHALREEGDLDAACGCGDACNISIHALREEGDWVQHFLHGGERNFYPRPPRGGRRGCLPAGRFRQLISIHALREEGDLQTA